MEVSLRQTWNTKVAVATYSLDANTGLSGLFERAAEDLASLKQLGASRHGEWLPDPLEEPALWKGLMAFTAKNITKLFTDQQELQSTLSSIKNENFLSIGARLVVLIEVKAGASNLSLDALGLSHDWLSTLFTMPDRLVVVMSGLPEKQIKKIEKLAAQIEGAQQPLVLELPKDREATKPQCAENDMPAEEDLLNIRHEVNAIADTIMLKATKPPMVVGVLGGWGWGKSSVMNLIQKRILKIRCQEAVEGKDSSGELDLFPFVGHAYPVWFDAWTYAKSDLWASLMYKIFSELDRMLYIESRIYEQGVVVDPRSESDIWQYLTRIDKTDLEHASAPDALKNIINSQPSYNVDRNLLWETLDGIKGQEHAALEKRKNALNADKEKLDKDSGILKEIEVNTAWRANIPKKLLSLAADHFDPDNEHGLGKKERQEFSESINFFNTFGEHTNLTRGSTWLAIITIFLLCIGFAYLLSLTNIVSPEFVSAALGLLGSGVASFSNFKRWSSQLLDTSSSVAEQAKQGFEDALQLKIDYYTKNPQKIDAHSGSDESDGLITLAKKYAKQKIEAYIRSM